MVEVGWWVKMVGIRFVLLSSVILWFLRIDLNIFVFC